MATVAIVPSIYINVRQYGATGNGSTDDTAAIQAALNTAGSAPGSAVFFPNGIYLVSSTLTYSGNIALIGCGDTDGGTVIRVKTGTALTTPVLASSDWYNNSTTCGNPVEIRDIKIDGNSATSGSSAHGIVMMNFWSIIERCSITGVAGDGLLITAHTQNGTHITNTCVETKVSRMQVRSCSGNGIHVHDSSSPLASCTDGFLEDCIVAGSGANGIYLEVASGWFISGNHIYGTVTNGLYAQKCYATRVIGNYIDGYGSGTSTFIAGIGMDCIDGRGSECIGNHVGYGSSSATGPYQSIRITGAGSATSVCQVIGNTVRGNAASGSLGYVLQTNASQQGLPWIIYFSNNDAQNVASYMFMDQYVTAGDTQLLGHLISIGGRAITAVAGSAAGTTPPSPVLTRANDVSGKVTFGTGTTPSAGAMVVGTFANAYANAPSIVIAPLNSATAALQLSVDRTASTFTVSAGIAPAASQANTVYGFFYMVASQ